MHVRLKPVALLVAALAVGPPAAVAGAGQADSAVRDYAGALQCGRNALFVFLALSGCRSLRMLQLAHVPITSQGASLLDLRDAAARFGVKTQMRRHPQTGIDAVPLPAIIQTRNRGADELTTDHFYVVYKVDEQHVFLVDSTTAQLKPMKRPFLPGIWTGKALVRARWYDALLDHRWLILSLLGPPFTGGLYLLVRAARAGGLASAERLSLQDAARPQRL